MKAWLGRVLGNVAVVTGLMTAAPVKAATLRLVTLEFPPLEYSDSSGQAAGAAVEVVREVLAGMGHQATIEVLPWARALDMVKAGKADAIFTAYRNAEREKFLDYSDEVLIPQVVSLYARKDSGMIYSGRLADLKGRTIGIMNTISYGQTFDRSKDRLGLRTERAESLELNLRKLAAGRIDLVISNRFSAEAEIARIGLAPQVVELSPPVEITPSYIGFAKANRLGALRDGFDQGLKRLKAAGAYRKIMQRHNVRIPD